MSNKFAFPLSLSSLLVAGMLVITPPAAAQGVEVGRATGQPALLDMPNTQLRTCWARYSTNGAQPRDGVIEERAFRVPCPETMTQSFIATLQRALAARGVYAGPITGQADPATRAAVQAFQKANGFNSPILTYETAQRLGLVPADLAAR
jgi:hypothetical protein